MMLLRSLDYIIIKSKGVLFSSLVYTIQVKMENIHYDTIRPRSP